MDFDKIASKSKQEPTVTLLKSDYDALLAKAEKADELQDLIDTREIMAAVERGEMEVFPHSVAEQLVKGEPPIRVFRKYRGLTGQQLADKAGVLPLRRRAGFSGVTPVAAALPY